jgi:protein SCO1/2
MGLHHFSLRLVALGVGLALISTPAAAQYGYFRAKEGQKPVNQQVKVLEQVTFAPKLNAALPLGARFRDEHGRDVALGEYFGRRPIVLALVYYECPMLCTQVLNGLVRSLRALGFDAGKEFDVVAVSFNAKEAPELAARKKQAYLADYNRPGTETGWHFLTGRPEAIAELTKSVGFSYVYDEKTEQFAHAAGIVVLTPDGHVSRYFYGIDYAPRDVRLGLIDASAGKIGSTVDRMLLHYCYRYDPSTGTYGWVAMTLIRAAAVGLLGVGGIFAWVMWRRERGGVYARAE